MRKMMNKKTISMKCSESIVSMEILNTIGFANFSVDVIYGLPGQKLADMIET